MVYCLHTRGCMSGLQENNEGSSPYYDTFQRETRSHHHPLKTVASCVV